MTDILERLRGALSPASAPLVSKGILRSAGNVFSIPRGILLIVDEEAERYQKDHCRQGDR